MRPMKSTNGKATPAIAPDPKICEKKGLLARNQDPIMNDLLNFKKNGEKLLKFRYVVFIVQMVKGLEA